MSQDIIDQFIFAMREAGYGPANLSDIKADDKRHDYQLEGDRKSKRKGFYKLKADGDFGFGFFGDYRQGDHVSWSAKAPKKYTPEERAAFKKRQREEKERAEAEQKTQWLARAREAQDTLPLLDPCSSHPYLTRKGVKAHGLLQSGDEIVIPMSDENGICNIQTIQPDGFKLFMPEAKKQGTWFEIPGDEVICIVEGYATGASVHEATGHTVIVAWDAGNLIHVAPKIRLKYSENRIIICGDNDQFTRTSKGELNNVGVNKAMEAAKKIVALAVWPEFKDLSEKPTDFNDLHRLEGLDAVRNKIRATGEAPLSVPKPLSVLSDSQAQGGDFIYDDAWKSSLTFKGRDRVLDEKSTNNLMLFMRYHEWLRGIFKYDSFAKRVIVHKCPPWEDADEFIVRPISDYDYFRLEAYMESVMGLKASKDKCADAIISTAKQKENTFNPASEYFKSLEWDGVPRLDSWLKKFVSDGSQPDDYLAIVGRKFLCGLAARAISPGIKFDTMIILEGKQYAGKSYLSRILATINDTEYFLDDFKDIENKDTLMKMQGKLVVEFPEISAMRKAEINDLKAFLTRTHDVFRPPYGRNPIEAGRQCVFVGTVNPEGPYLRDVTGNRRYWPIACRNSLDIEHLKEIVPLLHAEAAQRVKSGEQLWLDKKEYDICASEQEKRVQTDVWADRIADIVNGRDEIRTDDILAELNISVDKRTPNMQSRIAQTMISMGYHPCRLGTGTKRPRGFRKNAGPAAKELDIFEEEIPFD